MAGTQNRAVSGGAASPAAVPSFQKTFLRRRSFFFAYLLVFPLLLQLLFGAASFSEKEWFNWGYALFFRLLAGGLFIFCTFPAPEKISRCLLAGAAVITGIFNLLDIFLLVNFGTLFDYGVWKLMSIAPGEEVSGFFQLFLLRFSTLVILLIYPAAGLIIFKVKSRKILFTALLLFTGIIMLFFNCTSAGKIFSLSSPAERLTGFIKSWKSSQLRADLKKNAADVTACSSVPEALYTVIIGESHSRRRSSLYGFPVENMPRLKQLFQQKKIFRFDNAVTPHVMTHLAMPGLLTLQKKNTHGFSGAVSIMDLFRKAGFKVWYIYNQMPDSEDDLPFLAAAKRADVFISLSGRRRSHDGEAGKIFDELLHEPAPLKAVFIHLRGNHWEYGKTFPESFRHFKYPAGADRQTKLLTDYDNSLYYLDHFLAGVIRTAGKQKKNSFILYLPDHGESLYEEENFAGHTDLFPTAASAEIPMLLWLSENYARPELREKIRRSLEKPFISSDLPHLLLELSGVDSQLFIPERSLLNEAYSARPRLVSTKKIDYDSMKNRSKPISAP